MKSILFTFALGIVFTSSFAQNQVALNTNAATASTKFPSLDKSPMDMVYFPADYPMQKTQNKITEVPLIRVIYSRPQKDNRIIFGELIEYNGIWRMGANEATEIEFFKEVSVGGKKIAKGRYTLYAIPTPSKWTLIINKETDVWGAFIYDQKKDLVRVDLPVQKLDTPIEALSMTFYKSDKGAQLQIAWDLSSVSLPIDLNK